MITSATFIGYNEHPTASAKNTFALPLFTYKGQIYFQVTSKENKILGFKRFHNITQEKYFKEVPSRDRVKVSIGDDMMIAFCTGKKTDYGNFKEMHNYLQNLLEQPDLKHYERFPIQKILGKTN